VTYNCHIINALNKFPRPGFTVRPRWAMSRATANPGQRISIAIPNLLGGVSSEMVPPACNHYVSITVASIYPNEHFPGGFFVQFLCVIYTKCIWRPTGNAELRQRAYFISEQTDRFRENLATLQPNKFNFGLYGSNTIPTICDNKNHLPLKDLSHKSVVHDAKLLYMSLKQTLNWNILRLNN
jgi:hypothetical protein